MRFQRLAQASLLCAPLLASTRAGALTVVFNPGYGVPTNVMHALESAADRWSANLSTDITVRIDINWQEMGPGVLGTSNPYYGIDDYRPFADALAGHATSADDRAAVSHLGAGVSVNRLINHTLEQPGSAFGLDSSAILRNPMANRRALGLTGPSLLSDGSITLNSAMNWCLDPRSGVGPSQIDLVGIATHEIGHILGFGSGVDFLDSNPDRYHNEDLARITSVDLFRYSAQSAQAGAIDFTADGREKYFSLDGGVTKIAGFSTGLALGDGHQAGHWKDEVPSLGLLDPSGGYGELLQMSELDRRLFDVIGYTRNYTWAWSWAGGGNWSNALNWNANGVPTADVDVVFNLNAVAATPAYTVTLDADAAAHSVRVTGDDVTFNLGGRTLAAATDLVVGDVVGMTGRLTLVGPGTVSAQALHLGGSSAGAGGTGVLTVGTGSTLNVASARLWNTPGTQLTIDGGAVNATAIDNAATLAIPSGALRATDIRNSGTFIHSGGALAVSGSFTNTGKATFGPGQQWGAGSRLISDAGLVTFDAPAGSLAERMLAVTVNGGTLLSHSPQYLAALRINDGALVQMASGRTHTLVADELAMAGSGRLDLGDNDAIVFYSGQSPLAQFQQYVRDGQRFDRGIYASAAADPGLSQFPRALAVFDNNYTRWSSYNGVELGGDYHQIILKYTYVGDANLDGRVDPADYAAVDGLQGRGSSWPAGDLDGNGLVDAADYAMIDGNMGAGMGGDSGPPLFGSIGGTPQFSVIVPEPGAALLAAVAGLALLTRRRRSAAPT